MESERKPGLSHCGPIRANHLELIPLIQQSDLGSRRDRANPQQTFYQLFDVTVRQSGSRRNFLIRQSFMDHTGEFVLFFGNCNQLVCVMVIGVPTIDNWGALSTMGCVGSIGEGKITTRYHPWRRGTFAS